MKKYDLAIIDEFTYSLTIDGDYALPIYQTIKKILKNAYYDSDASSIFFSAESVFPFKQYLLEHNKKYIHSIKIIDELTKQIFYLKKMGYGFYGFDINDILVIDDIFIFCSAEHLLPIVDDNIIFYSPIKTPYFSSPEILELTTLPSEINYKCSYYSLGALVVFCLLNKYLLVGNEIKSLEEVEVILSPLYNTKIYWFIKRCLEENVDKRVLLLI
jgi:hypothetical protein